MMTDDVSLWVALKRVALSFAPQWWMDMLVGRAMRKVAERCPPSPVQLVIPELTDEMVERARKTCEAAAKRWGTSGKE